MGVRAIIDEVCTDKLFDMKRFDLKVAEFCKVGLVSDARKKVLLKAFDAGSAAAHRGYRPAWSVVEMLVDFVEHFLQDMYVLEDIAIELLSG